MSTVNIRRDVKDAFYRYKMPKLQSKIEGKGNGIKTVVPNMAEIGKALNRSPTYVTKFFGSELGAQTICDEKNSRYIVNGAHEAERLMALLDLFIQKFVLCPGCENPETTLTITRDEKVIRSCKACGQRNPVDAMHRLTTFILKNPVHCKKEAPAEREEKGSSEGPPSGPLANGGSANAAPGSAGTALLKEAPASLLANMSISQDFEACEAGDASGNEDDSMDEFASFVAENRLSPDIVESRAAELGVRADKAAAIIVQVVFTEDVVNEIPKMASLLARFTHDNPRAQRAVLGGLERVIGIIFPGLEKKITPIFLALYNSDIVEEPSFLKWHEKPSRKYVDKEIAKKIRKLADPFITWLREAEEEDDEE